MWKWIVVLCLAMSISCAHAGILSPYPTAKLTILAVDDDQLPLSNMQVHVWLSESAIRDGWTDNNGIFIAEGPCTIKDIPITILKEGFYDSRTRYEYPNYQSIIDHKWQPWNPLVKVLVRRIVKPIPMYAKQLHVVVPVLDQLVGFDLVKADWIVPYGVGEVADVMFQIKKRWVDVHDFESSLDLLLPNKGDGLQETSLSPSKDSTFKLGRSAPTEGYDIINMHLSDSSKSYFVPDEQQSFYFRIRTVTNDSRQDSSALYGKIRTYIGFDARKNRTTISFSYYLNPTPNDRNLEFDPKHNLFTDLESWQEVRQP